MPPRRSAQADPLAVVGARGQADRARVPGRVLRAARPRARHLRAGADARVRGGGVGLGVVRGHGAHAGLAARPHVRRPRGVRVHGRARRRSRGPDAGGAGRGSAVPRSRLRRAAPARGRAAQPAERPRVRPRHLGRRAARARGPPARPRRAEPRAGGERGRRPRRRAGDGRRAAARPRADRRRAGRAVTPPGLLGAALLFWGWQTGFLAVGVVMAALVEGRQLVRSRWDLSRTEFPRVSDLSAVVLAGWAFWSARPRRYPAAVWLATLAVAVGLGWAGHVGIAAAQRAMERVAQSWLLDLIRRDTDPFKSSTALGEIGEVKLSTRILLRVESADCTRPPALLREATYNVYNAPTWYAVDAAFISVPPEADAATWKTDPPVIPPS